MAAESSKLARIPSGVPGLDAILAGGFFETGVYLIEGAPGAGKTILANQICFHQASLQRRVVYYTLLTESHDRMMRFLAGMSFFTPAAVPDWVTYVSGFKVLEAEGLTGLLRNIRDTISARKASLLVIDGLVALEHTAASELAFRKFLHELQAFSSMYRCTVLLLGNPDETHQGVAEHTDVEGVLKLDASVIRLKPVRWIEVVKFRGAAQSRGKHTLAITDAGVVVYPRIETVLVPGGERPGADQVTRRKFDSPTLDALLGGGLMACTNTMLLGPSGVGKTVLSLQFAHGGVVARENVLFFTFFEQPRELLAKARRLGLTSMDEAAESRNLRIEWQSSVEASLDKIGSRLVEDFEAFQPTRVVIDGIQGFQVTTDPPERIHDFFAAVSDFFGSRGATMLFTVELDDLLTPTVIQSPFSNASRMCQNILLMRFVERGGDVGKVLSIVKMRDSGFDTSVRALKIGPHGVELGPREHE